MKLHSLLAALAVGLAPTASWACGACVEDKMAATYDHAVVKTAASQGKSMVFCEVRGQVLPQRLRKAVARVAGVDLASIRTSTSPPAVSFALDTSVRSADSAASLVARALGPGVDVVVLRTLPPAAAAD